jgi:glycosyltransferase involved in cell wall biosynthesis
LRNRETNSIPDAPRITPAEMTGPRPLYSVMIPTYNPEEHYLKEALWSVLQQDPGPEQMQIEVIDDCSPNVNVQAMVKSIGQGRIAFFQTPNNLGLAGCWNACIEKSKGEWIHILHQDDIVFPGFYAAMRKGTNDAGVGAAFCRHATINPNGHWLAISELHRETAVALDDFSEQIMTRQIIQCPSIIIRRAAYEQLGGFLPRFHYTLDWEMWQRIATKYSFWYEPAILAGYRVHSNSATSRLQLEAGDIREVREMISLTMTYPPASKARLFARRAGAVCAVDAVGRSRRLLAAGHARAAWKQIFGALLLARNWYVFCEFLSFLVLRVRLAGAQLKRHLRQIL